MPLDPQPSAPGAAPRDPDTAVRRALLWWFQAPASAHVAVNFAIDFSQARAYLARLAAQDAAAETSATGQPPARVTVQHLLVAAVARSLAAFPLANAQIVGRRIVVRERVGVAMPVNLLGHPGGKRRELGVSILADADRLSLRELAVRGQGAVAQERSGRGTNRLVRQAVRLAERAPPWAFYGVMDGYERLRQGRLGSELVYRAAPATTLISNAGAPFQPVPGVLFRGGALSPPTRLGHVGTVWGTSTVQDEVVVVDGQPAVRPMLPLLLLFDHRLLDGVAAGRLALHFAGLLTRPEEAFGPTGQAHRPGSG
ncbi:2-oxo acid dehydrogenase subunit E2 [Myxococcota bacterium]|nr:2-oxo acid dehydrogenase subunit E2 [Myxococcota bacterium]